MPLLTSSFLISSLCFIQRLVLCREEVSVNVVRVMLKGNCFVRACSMGWSSRDRNLDGSVDAEKRQVLSEAII